MGKLFMDKRYNVYFAGQLLDGQDHATVRSRLGKLFKADAATLDKLFSGKAQLIKRNCDRATALKYKQAMEQAGATPIIRATEAEAVAAPPTDAPTSEKLSAAQRIAMLANAPDVGRHQAPTGSATQPQPAEPGSMGIMPAGSDVLRPEERQGPIAASVASPDLEVAPGGERLSATAPPPPPAPDTSHLSAAEVGETLPNLPRSETALSPDTSGLDLSPQGTDFSDCAPADPIAPALDLSGIELAPSGADVLEQQYRKRHDEPAPNTDHLSLDD